MGIGTAGGRRWSYWLRGLFLASLMLALPPEGPARADSHGASMGKLKYPAGFSHFEYARPDAPKGGTLVLSRFGSFDTLNPFGLKGRPPLYLGSLLFESLTDNSLDEPFSVYGRLASSIEIAEDGMSVLFRLNPLARFSDGRPVTAQDVLYSLKVLRSEAASPFYRYYYNDISEAKAVDKLSVRFSFSRRNAELPLIMGQLPVLPRHHYGEGDFGRDFVTLPLGSGPYRVADYDFGKSITYERNPGYWGRELNVNKGQYNFDRIVVKFYRDNTVRLEALKAGEFDFMWINSSKQWAVDVGGKKWDQGYLVKEMLKHGNNAGMQGFVFNIRKHIFANRDVRHALALALDFEWSNRTLFYGQYKPMHSYFSNSELAAGGLPSAAELALLEPLRKHLPQALFTQPVEPLGKGYKTIRQRLRAAKRLLNGAGWFVKDGVLTEKATGRAMEFTITLVSPAFERITEPFINNMRKLGVLADMRVVDDAVYEQLIRNHDYEMVVNSFGQSLSPGNEQRDFWHSSSASQEGSRNLIGIENPAVDALVEAIIKAPGRRALIDATRALDRVLWHEHYLVPHWYIDRHRVTYWNKFSRPAKLPLYYNPMDHLLFWWADPAAGQALEAAIKAGRALPVAR